MDEHVSIPLWVPDPSEAREDHPVGRIKAIPSDFVVEEIPAYEPQGEGTHRYLWIEKEDVSAPHLVKTVSRRLGVHPGDVGTAGQKDRRAITRQWLSVPADVDVTAASLDGPIGETGRITLLDQGIHTNKLRTGHLKGNHFTVRVTEREPRDDAPFLDAAARMESEGFTNTYGPQRFGHERSVAPGLGLLRGEGMRDKRRRRFAVSALQSALFNRWAELRHAGAGFSRALVGDLLMKTDSGGVFMVEDPDVETARILAGELVVTGPIFGNKARRAEGDAHEYERAALATYEMTSDAFKRTGLSTTRGGASRALDL